MTPKEIYALPAMSYTHSLYRLWSKDSPDVFPNAPAPLADSIEHPAIIVNTIVAICTDGYRRTWELYTVYYSGKPFAIVSLGGREGEDYVKTYITNDNVYQDFLTFLMTSVLERSGKLYDYTNPDEEIPNGILHSSWSLEEASEYQHKFTASRINKENLGMFSESLKSRFK